MSESSKTLFFVSGLPRSGSTLLCNILYQNPRFYVTASSGLIDLVRQTRNAWRQNPFLKATPEPLATETRLSSIKGLMQGYFGITDRPVCFDKNRGWPVMLELLCHLYGRDNVKIIACVRDLRDVLASFEKLYRRTMATQATSQEIAVPLKMRTALGRARLMVERGEPVVYALNVLTDAVTRGFRDNILFVDYTDFMQQPDLVFARIYAFLEVEHFDHRFDNVLQVTKEDDNVHGFVGLHDIRSEVKPQGPQWTQVYDHAILATPFWQEVTSQAKFWLQL